MKHTLARETLLVHAGHSSDFGEDFVNPPLVRASTVLHRSTADMQERADAIASGKPAKTAYGTYGTPTHEAFYKALCAIEGGAFAWAFPTGLAACTQPLFAFVKAGCHVLFSDSIYGPTRDFLEQVLTNLGVEVEAFDPALGAGVAKLIRPNTTLAVLETVGSHSFEVMDIPAICQACRARGVVTAVDSTWGTPLYFRPLEAGADIVVHAATKYIAGHADLLMGVVICNERTADAVRRMVYLLGQTASADDVYAAYRGLHTMAARVERATATTRKVIDWLQKRPEVERVLWPALPTDPGYALWKRDYTGATSLFAVAFKPEYQSRISAMVDAVELFGRGYSWGGYESLMIPSYGKRTVRSAPFERMVRIAIGMDAPQDLIADLEQAFERLHG